MLLRLLQWVYNLYQAGVNPTLETKRYDESTERSKNIKMDSREIAQIVSDLNTLLGDAERIQEETSTKVDELTEIKDGLEEANGNLGEALSALEGLEDIVETVEGLLNDADSEGIN